MLTGAHIADVHFGGDKDFLEEIVRCSSSAAGYIERTRPDFVMCTGDLFDHRLLQDSPAALEARKFVRRIAAVSPMLVLRGTDLHDFDSLDSLIGLPNVMIVSEAKQVFFRKGVGFYDCNEEEIPDAIFSCLPSPSKAFNVSLGASPEQAKEEVVDLVRKVMRGWGEVNAIMREAGAIAVMAAHGTVTGSVTSTGQVMIGHDLEYGTHDLSLVNADYIGFGHIHRAQKIGPAALPAWFAGSLGRLDSGEQEEKGFLMVDLEPGKPVEPKFVRTPARKYLIIDLGKDPVEWHETVRAAVAGEPMDENTVVKVKTVLSETRADDVTRKQVEGIVGREIIFDKTVMKIQRTRADGISALNKHKDKYIKWAETADQPRDEQMLARVDMLDLPLASVLDAVKQKFYLEEAMQRVEEPAPVQSVVSGDPVAVQEPTAVPVKKKAVRKKKANQEEPALPLAI